MAAIYCADIFCDDCADDTCRTIARESMTVVSDYLNECVEECRANVADQMEADGYEVTGKPDPPKPYNPVDAFRLRIRHNLNPYYKG